MSYGLHRKDWIFLSRWRCVIIPGGHRWLPPRRTGPAVPCAWTAKGRHVWSTAMCILYENVYSLKLCAFLTYSEVSKTRWALCLRTALKNGSLVIKHFTFSQVRGRETNCINVLSWPDLWGRYNKAIHSNQAYSSWKLKAIVWSLKELHCSGNHYFFC